MPSADPPYQPEADQPLAEAGQYNAYLTDFWVKKRAFFSHFHDFELNFFDPIFHCIIFIHR
jgi:hypothetical protein